MSYILRRCETFPLGLPAAEQHWARAEPARLTHVGGGTDRETWVRMLWSQQGIYIRIDCVDEKLAGAGDQNFGDLYTGDVVEIFLHPHRETPVYLEYELSPLDAELPLLVCNSGSSFHGWLPFHYDGPRRAVHCTQVWGGEKLRDAPCTGWRAECFLPFALLEGVLKKQPVSGDVWYGNVFRIDYGGQETDRYALFPACKTDFHDVRFFEPLTFG